jgi:hypothetical protein
VIAPPFRLAYWVDEPRFMAGCFPGHVDPRLADRQLSALLGAGLRTFVDLMDEDPRFGAAPYAPRLEALAAEGGAEVTVLRFEVSDNDVPSHVLLTRILDAIDAAIAAARPVYLHCWGGRGRAGTVVGAWLVRHGRATGENFVEVIARLRAGAPGTSPETDEQIAFVRDLRP